MQLLLLLFIIGSQLFVFSYVIHLGFPIYILTSIMYDE